MDRLFAYEFSATPQSEVRWGLSGVEDSRGTLLIKKFDVTGPGTHVRSSGNDYSVGFTNEKLVDFVVSHQTPEMQARIRKAQTGADSGRFLSEVRVIAAQAKAQIAADHVLDKAINENPSLRGELSALRGKVLDEASVNAAVEKAKANVALDGAIAAAGTDAAKKAVLQQLKAGG
ncbi:hypothetical protein DF039_38400, partial [Burkholderia cenocepacia]